jgi:hypothetical protein
VLLAGLIDLGPQSAPAQSLLHGVSEGAIRDPATAWHCCLEFCSVEPRGYRRSFAWRRRMPCGC